MASWASRAASTVSPLASTLRTVAAHRLANLIHARDSALRCLLSDCGIHSGSYSCFGAWSGCYFTIVLGSPRECQSLGAVQMSEYHLVHMQVQVLTSR